MIAPVATMSAIVADTSPIVSEGLAALCESLGGCQVLAHCSDGNEAWRLIVQLLPDLAIVDAQLSGMPALDLVRGLREMRLRTRALVVASRGDRRMALEALRGGASGFLLKSGTARHLEEAIHAVRAGGVYVSPQVDEQRPLAALRNTDNPIDSLSHREQQVFTMLVDGVRAKDIAIRLSLSPKTVDTYRASLMRKLAIHDVPGLVKLAILYRVVEIGA